MLHLLLLFALRLVLSILALLILRLAVLIQLLLEALASLLCDFLASSTALGSLLGSGFLCTLGHDAPLTSLGCLDDAVRLLGATLGLAVVVVASSLLENASTSILETPLAALLLWLLRFLLRLIPLLLLVTTLVLLGIVHKVALLLHLVWALALRVCLVAFGAGDPS